MANTIKVEVLGDVKDLNKKLGDVDSKLGKFGGAMKGLGAAVAGAFAVGAIVDFGKQVVSAASDAQQSMGATETVFGKASQSIVKASETAAEKYGLSANTYRENANLIGSLFKNQGVSVDQLAGKTDKMIGTASDLAATFGGSTTSAVEALSSAFKGEFDPLEKYGISIKQSDINARLAAKGQDKLTGAALKAAQSQATTDLIMQQSTSSLGAFGKESDTLAHQQQVLGAKFDNLKVTIGTALLPVLTQLASFASDTLLPALQTAGEWIGNNIPPLFEKAKAAFVAFIAPLQPVIDKVKEFFAGFTAGGPQLQAAAGFFDTYIVPLLPKVTAVFSAIGEYVSAAMGLIAQVISVVTAGISFVWRNWGSGILSFLSGTLSNMLTIVKGVLTTITGVFKLFTALLKGDWSGAWSAIKQIASGAASTIGGIFSQLWLVIRTAFSAGISVIKGAWSGFWTLLKSLVSSGMSSIGTAVSGGIDKVTGFFTSLPGKITSALGSLATTLYTAGSNMMQGMINGIQSMAGRIANAALEPVKSAVANVKNFLGIASPSRLFRRFGQFTGEGLILGFKDMNSKVERAASGMAGSVTSGFGSPSLSVAGMGSSSPSNGHTYNINVSVPPTADAASVGREVIKALEAAQRQGARIPS